MKYKLLFVLFAFVMSINYSSAQYGPMLGQRHNPMVDFYKMNGVELPFSWQENSPGLNSINTLMPDGTILRQIQALCPMCRGVRFCQICNGRGMTNFYYQRTCSNCMGSGACRTCGGRGYTIMVNEYRPGIGSVTVDERGITTFTVESSGGSSSRNSSDRNKSYVYKCCSGAPSFGLDGPSHRCSNCGDLHRIGSSHSCIKKR